MRWRRRPPARPDDVPLDGARPDGASAPGSGPRPCVVTLEDVHVRLGERDVLRGVDLVLREQRIGIVGANGSGKSTLARLLNGLVLPTRGRVLVDDLDTRRQGAAVRRRVGFVFTDPDAQIVMPTVAEDVAYSLRRTAPGPARDERVRAALAARGLDGHADHPAHLLSGGQKQLLALTSVLVTDPDLVVADEPTTLLDRRNARRVADELAALPQQVVLVSHDLDLVARIAQRVLVVDDGRVVADGAPDVALVAYRRLTDAGTDAGTDTDTDTDTGLPPTGTADATARRSP